MKVLALVILVVGSSSALGSGPYLPSGWRPSGPAFYLPTETEKPTAAVPLKDVPVQQTDNSGSSFLREYGPAQEVQVEEVKVQVEQETSGSDAFREYGPPKSKEVSEVSQDLTVQALPDPITEQAFVVIQAKFNEEEKSADVAVDAESASVESTKEETSINSAVREDKAVDVETQTESSLAVSEDNTEKLGEVLKEMYVEVGQPSVAEVIQQESEVSNVAAAVEQKSEEVVEVKVMEEGVKNIAEALVNLENEIKAQQVQTEVTVLRSSQESSGSNQQGPAGFLEYGPPGFTEYGPPKSNLAAAEETSPNTIETNETRRRRFSPKFRKPSRKA